MTVECIDGMAGRPHIGGDDKGRLHAGIAGEGSYVLGTGRRLAATRDGSNRVTIGTGDALVHGRHVSVTESEQVTIESGTQGQRRNDLICLQYHREQSSGVEGARLTVLKGAPSASAAADPSVPGGNVLEGAADDYMPLYRVSLDGVDMAEPVALFEAVPSLSTVRDSTSRLPNSARIALYSAGDGSVWYRRLGGIVEVTCDIVQITTVEWTVPERLPAGFRPATVTASAAVLATDRGIENTCGGITVMPDGTVKIQGGSKVAYQRKTRGNVTFIAAQ